jgi:hypothetical protein
VLQLYGRRTLTDSQIKKGAAKHIYLPSPLTGIWNDQVLRASSEVILCEALIDAMMFWCAGYSNVEHPGVAGGSMRARIRRSSGSRTPQRSRRAAR